MHYSAQGASCPRVSFYLPNKANRQLTWSPNLKWVLRAKLLYQIYQACPLHVGYYHNTDFFYATILEDQAQWRDKTKGLSKLVIENNAWVQDTRMSCECANHYITARLRLTVWTKGVHKLTVLRCPCKSASPALDEIITPVSHLRQVDLLKCGSLDLRQIMSLPFDIRRFGFGPVVNDFTCNVRKVEVIIVIPEESKDPSSGQRWSKKQAWQNISKEIQKKPPPKRCYDRGSRSSHGINSKCSSDSINHGSIQDIKEWQGTRPWYTQCRTVHRQPWACRFHPAWNPC